MQLLAAENGQQLLLKPLEGNSFADTLTNSRLLTSSETNEPSETNSGLLTSKPVR